MRNDNHLKSGVILIDLMLMVFATSVTFFWYRHFSPVTVESINRWLNVLPVLVALFACVEFMRPPLIISSRQVSTERVVINSTMFFVLFWFLTVASIAYLYSRSYFPRQFLVVAGVVYYVLLVAERLIIRKLLMIYRSKHRHQCTVVLVGDNPALVRLYRIFEDPFAGCMVTAVFCDNVATAEAMGVERQGRVADALDWFEGNHIDEVYVYLEAEEGQKDASAELQKKDSAVLQKTDASQLLHKIFRYCDNNMIRCAYVPSFGFMHTNYSLEYVDDTPVVRRREEPLTNWYNKLVKRTFDVVVSSVFLLTLFWPIFIIVAIVMKCTSPGPIFFRQDRTGFNGRTFRIFKFRSMHVNKDADKLQATKNDPRVYPFGLFMRKTNIDELPQFINVFMGSMSVVGPRPHMLAHTDQYSHIVSRYMVRHLAKPGITGLAQVSGFRGETEHVEQMEGRVRKDIEYIENWSFVLDLKIICKTVANMIVGDKQAY